jgi:hypothetical protein
VTLSQEDPLRGGAREHLRAEEDVVPLLLGEPCRHPEKGDLGVHREAYGTLEPCFAAGLSAEVDLIVRGFDERVVLRIPDRVVDSVEDADEAVLERVERVVQSESAVPRAQLDRVRGRDGGDHVGKDEASLEEVDVPVPLQEVRVVERWIDPEVTDDCGRIVPLIAGVVHREHRRHPVVIRIARQHRAQVDGGERGMPVVRMDRRMLRRHAWQPLSP